VTRTGLTLVGEGFSPWTEKARWALDHYGVRYRYEEYAPLVDEPWLRLRARRLRGRISVPFLLGPGLAVGDSFAIAREAERLGDGAPLLPPDLLAAIEAWNARSDRLIAAGRAQVLARTDASAAAQAESLPAFVPPALRPRLAGLTRLGTAYIRWKYAVRPVPDELLEVDLAAVRAAIGTRHPATPREPGYLLDRFTYADVAVAAALQALRPHGRFPAALGPAQRDTWARPALAARWEDVLAWRDLLIDRHRAGSAPS
jgi:glutathione S-transferase